MNGLIQDVRSALRSLLRRPGLTATVLVTLTVAIGVNTAIFGVIETNLINPLACRDADRLVYLFQHNEQLGMSIAPSAELIDACREQASSFEQLETYATAVFNVTGEGEPALMAGARVSPGFFDFLGVRPILGRTFRANEDRPGEHRVTILSHALWQSRFGADREVLDRTLMVDDERYRIVGVLPADFQLFAYSDIRFWIPQHEAVAAVLEEGPPLHTIARLAEGVSAKEAQAELDVISDRLRSGDGSSLEWRDLDWTGRVVTPQARLDSRLRTAMLVLQWAVGLVLLIACANVAHLLLASGESRAKELALRSVLGARRTRLVSQLLSESLILAMIGGATGFVVSRWSHGAILAMAPGELGLGGRLAFDWSHLAFAVGVAAVTGVAFGLVPALRGSRPDPYRVLKDAASDSAAPRRRAVLRQALVALEVALALVLLVGAGVLIKNFIRLQSLDPGFEMRNLLTLRIELPDSRYPDGESQRAFYDHLQAGLRGLGGHQVRGVALTSGIGSSLSAILARPEVEGGPARSDAPQLILPVVTASPGYFATMGIPLRHGRGFSDDDRDGSEPVVVINETLARRYLPGENPVGRRIRLGQEWYRIVGVAADIWLPALGTNRELDLLAYYPSSQSPDTDMTLIVRTADGADRGSLVDTVKARVWDIDPKVPITRVAGASELAGDAMVQQRFNALLMGLFAAIAIVLASVGIYGVVACSMSARTREIGIRLALGATRGDVLREHLGRAMGVVVVGLVLGLGIALGAAQVLGSLVQEISVRDPATVAAVSMLVTIVALLATWLPVRRAVWLDPMAALRHE